MNDFVNVGEGYFIYVIFNLGRLFLMMSVLVIMDVFYYAIR
jgi:hypothetical protein